jgi:hypothetical protein
MSQKKRHNGGARKGEMPEFARGGESVRIFGREKAEELLKALRAELR